MKIKKIFEFLINIVYPRRCPICHDIISTPGESACRDCRKNLHYVQEPYCMKCGKPLMDEAQYCNDCLHEKRYFTEGRAVFLYDAVMKESIYSFKYGKRQEYAEFYAEEIEKRLGAKIRSYRAQALIPIPLHKSRLKSRGYNQAELLANALGRKMELPVISTLLTREKKTAAQKELSAKERENNLKRAFKIEKNDVKLNTVILVDDIYTTGSTINAAAQCLKDAGVLHVFFVVLSIGKDTGENGYECKKL